MREPEEPTYEAIAVALRDLTREVTKLAAAAEPDLRRIRERAELAAAFAQELLKTARKERRDRAALEHADELAQRTIHKARSTGPHRPE